MNILFICYANVCRSYAAEKIMQRLRPNDKCFSRGIYANPDFTVPQKMLDFLKDEGFQEEYHVPARLTKEDMASADYVFFMEEEHYEMIAERWSQFLNKMYLLAEFAGEKKNDIEDPIGLHGRAFAKSMAKLKIIVQNVAELL